MVAVVSGGGGSGGSGGEGEGGRPRMPRGIPFIVGNEAAERFSYYGMRTVLVVFMTEYLRGASGELAPMGEGEAAGWYQAFLSAVYFFPVLGALLSDGFLGKYRTVIWLSVVYCLGHLALALDGTRWGLFVGLGLIALGSGGIKPCVAANLGDQFSRGSEGLLSRAFGWFYFSVNWGAFFSALLTPWLLLEFGAHWAFGVPGVLMFVATVVFWLGRNVYVRVPARGMGFLRELVSGEGLVALGKLGVLYLFFAVFWSVYDQNGSVWVLQARDLDRVVLDVGWVEGWGPGWLVGLVGWLVGWLGDGVRVELLAAQFQALNPLLVMVFIPLFGYGLYPLLGRVFVVSGMRKIGMGFFLAVVSVLLVGWLEWRLQLGEVPSIGWQVLAIVVLTAAEVMVYQTGLELSYTQAPLAMKSLVSSFFSLSIALGNGFASGVNFFVEGEVGSRLLGPVGYHLFFAGLMFWAAVLFVFVSRFFRERSYLQGGDGG